MPWPEGARGVLLDVDGTLIAGDRAVPGAAAAIGRLRDRDVPFCVTTNTTRRPRGAVAAALRDAGIEIDESEVLAPSVLATRRIVESGRLRAALMVADASRVDFAGVDPVEEGPDWVVVGDLGRGFTWERLNLAFRWLREGARLIALQKNRYWKNELGESVLDAGPFVAALEYAAGVAAEIVGKPSREFFDLALAEIGLPAGAVLVVGDDVETDCAGGAAAGCRTALVRTGKFDERALGRARARPDLILDSIADLSVT